ncbi:hypothetical protein Tco_1167985 [Tanacetum coccineum]
MIVGNEESRHGPSDAMHKPFPAIRVSLKRNLSHLSRRYTRTLLTSHSEIVDIEYKCRCCSPIPAKSDSSPHAHTQALKVNNSTSRRLLL